MRKLWLYLVTLPVMGQQPLSLHDAVALALRENRAVVAAEAGVRAADERLNQAKSGMLPRVNISESAMRGNNPVYVFSSLLTQHQFGAGNFNLGPLNRPDALTNFQTQLTVDQPIYDARQTRNATSTAQLSGRMAAEDQRRTRMETIARVAQTYYGAILAVENLKAAGQAVRSAEVLAGILSPTGPAEMVLGSLEKEAAEGRAETRQSRLATSLAEVQNRAAHDSWLPQIGVRAAFETDAQRFVTRGGANWMAGVTVRWNVFNGFADRAKMAETSRLLEKARADEQRAGSAVKLQVRQAYAGLQAASQRIQVAATAVAAAEESLRITQNRYEAGLATVTDLLRTETALLDTKTRYLASLHDERLAATMVEFAAGRLTADSGVLNQ